MTTQKKLRLVSAVMFLVAAGFVFAALSAPTLGSVIRIGPLVIGATVWQVCYVTYFYLMLCIFSLSFFRETNSALFLFAAALPFPFLALWGDAAFGTMVCYLLWGAMMVVLRWKSRRMGQQAAVLVGTVVSLPVCYLAMTFFADKKWTWYFKPLRASQLLLLLWGVTALVHLIGFLRRKKH